MSDPTLPGTDPIPPPPPVPPEWNAFFLRLTDARDQAYANWIKQTAHLIEALRAGDYARSDAILLDCRAHVDYLLHLWRIEHEAFELRPKAGITEITLPDPPYATPLWPPPQ